MSENKRVDKLNEEVTALHNQIMEITDERDKMRSHIAEFEDSELTWFVHKLSESIIRISDLAISSIPMNQILDEILQVLNADLATLYLANQVTGQLFHPPIMSGVRRVDEAKASGFVGENSIVRKIFEGKEEYWYIEDVKHLSTPSMFRNRPFTSRENVRTLLAYPLSASRERVGVLFINFKSVTTFTEKKLAKLNKYFNSIAQFINVSRQQSDLNDKSNILNNLVGLTKYSTFSNTSENVLVDILDGIQRGANTKYTFMLLIHNESPDWYFAPKNLKDKTELRYSRSITNISRQAIELDKQIHVNNARDPNWRKQIRNEATSEHFGAFICTPIVREDGNALVLWLVYEMPTNFSKDILSATLLYARHLSSAYTQIKKSEDYFALQKRTIEIAHVTASNKIRELVRDVVSYIDDLLNCNSFIKISNQDNRIINGDIIIAADENQRIWIQNQFDHSFLTQLQNIADKPIVLSPEGAFSAVSNKTKSDGTTISLGQKLVYLLTFKANTQGLIGISFDHQRWLAQSELDILSMLTTQLSVSIRNISLYRETLYSRKQLSDLYRFSQELHKLSTTNEVYKQIIVTTRRILGVKGRNEKCFISISSVKDQILSFATAGSHDKYLGERWDINISKYGKRKIGIIGCAVKKKQTVYVEDVRENKNYIERRKFTKSQIAIPLLSLSGNALAVLSIEYPELSPFNDDDVKNLEVICATAASALDAILTVEIEKKWNAVLSTIGTEGTDLKSISVAILNWIKEIIPYTSASVQLVHSLDRERELLALQVSNGEANLDLENSEINPHLTRPIEDDPLITYLVDNKEIIVYSDVKNKKYAKYWEISPSTEHIASWIGIPLIDSDKILGIITISHAIAHMFTAKDRERLNVVRSQATIALSNALNIDEIIKYNKLLKNSQDLAMIGLVFGEDLHLTANHLGAARTFAEFIRRDRDNDIEVRRYGTYIVTEIEKVLELIEQVTQSVDEPTVSEVNVKQLIEDVVTTVNISPLIQIKWDRNWEMIDPIINAPEDQLRQVMRVIVFNAKDFMEGEGTITLSINESSDRIETLTVTVSDTGPGIRNQDEVFKVGKKNKRRRKRGFAFGLAWSRLFMNRYGGDITFDTEVGQGTDMHIHCPRNFVSIYQTS
ncbi:MAG: GAF domain-containing protein [Chloroflexota bacterium]